MRRAFRVGRRALPFVVTTALLAPTAPAGAQSRPAAQAPADALFTEGRDLLEKGRFAEACAKLSRSEELAPAVGTLLNLGYCWEQLGKLRSAMDAYAEAESLALTANDPKRAGFAKERFAAVEPRTVKLVVRLTLPEPSGLVIKRNNVVLTKSELDHPIAVDPEDYVVTASAPGYETWRGAIVVRGEGAVVTLIVPQLADGGSSPAVSVTGGLGFQRIIALGVGGLGVFAIGGGLATALSAKSRWNDASSHCDARGCDEVGASIQSDAVAQGNLGTIFLGLGVVAVGAGVYLWLKSPPARATTGALLRPTASGLGGSF